MAMMLSSPMHDLISCPRCFDCVAPALGYRPSKVVNTGRVFLQGGSGGRRQVRHTVNYMRKEDVPSCNSSDESSLSRDGELHEEVSSGIRPGVSSLASAAFEGGDGAGLGDFSLIQTRRFWLGTTVGILVSLVGNLAGITSAILTLNPKVWRNLRVDVIYPVKGFKRCLETTQGFEFIYPSSWVGDQRLLYRAVERAERERERALEIPPIQGLPQRPRRGSSRDPIVAFGPPGTNGELNVSVIVAPVFPGFTLQAIGGPNKAGELIVKQFIAPEGSNKVATLLNAEQRRTEDQLYYTLEYTVKGSTFFWHNLAVYTIKSGLLYSLNAQTSESTWNAVQGDFIDIANSFKLLM